MSRINLIFVLILGFTALSGSLSLADDQIALRIINGEPISSRNSPVVLVKIKTSSGTGLCSGSILASNAVLTASHCVSKNVKNMSVVIAGRTFSEG